MRLRPLLHGRDHEHGGADPTRIVYEDVGDSGGGGGGGVGIDFNKSNTTDAAGADADYLKIEVNGTGDDGAGDAINLTNAGAAGNIVIRQDGGGDLIIEDNVAGTLEVALNAPGPMHLYNNGTGSSTLIEIKNTGDGGIQVHDLGDGGVNITGAFGGVTITMNDSSYLRLVNLPTSNPGGTNRVWNSGGTLKIT